MCIESAMETTARCLVELKMYLVVDVLKFKAMDNLTHDIILGMNFIKKWDIESRRKRKKWRVCELVLKNGE